MVGRKEDDRIVELARRDEGIEHRLHVPVDVADAVEVIILVAKPDRLVGVAHPAIKGPRAGVDRGVGARLARQIVGMKTARQREVPIAAIDRIARRGEQRRNKVRPRARRLPLAARIIKHDVVRIDEIDRHEPRRVALIVGEATKLAGGLGGGDAVAHKAFPRQPLALAVEIIARKTELLENIAGVRKNAAGDAAQIQPFVDVRKMPFALVGRAITGAAQHRPDCRDLRTELGMWR